MKDKNNLGIKISDKSVVNLDYYQDIMRCSNFFWNLSSLGESIKNDEVERFLLREARLLDQHCFDEWLLLFLDSSCYWIPGSSPAKSPASEVTLEFHDVRRLKDRVVRIQTGYAYSQVPLSKTNRIIGTPEIWEMPGVKNEYLARASFIMYESRDGKSKIISGWYGYVIVLDGAEMKIKMKQINLNDSCSPQGNHSFFL